MYNIKKKKVKFYIHLVTASFCCHTYQMAAPGTQQVFFLPEKTIILCNPFELHHQPRRAFICELTLCLLCLIALVGLAL